MFFFRKRVRRGPEIISIHIPKCAGSSFRGALQAEYGSQLHLDYQFRPCVVMPPETRIVHGHFPLAKYAECHPKARRITWLRDPVSRVLSYYYYWKRVPPHGNPLHDRFLAENPNVARFAGHPSIRDEVEVIYLGASNWQRLDFVGIVERYGEDLAALAGWLGWKKMPRALTVNEGPSRGLVSDDERRTLREVLAGETRIYEHWRDKGPLALSKNR